MFNIVLYEPEIPPNTGNIIRLAANSGSTLHLVQPLGFPLDHAKMRRAGLDYHEFAHLQVHANWLACRQALAAQRWFAATTKAQHRYDQIQFQAGDVLVFGPETRGLPDDVLQEFPPAQRLRIPMLPNNRSLNLSNAVAVLVYEAWRQQDFCNSISSKDW